ncbi:uncharacterized protein LOC116168078 [Photinus pyralis]|uniref:uncharacterized protein LOC116168078 n=1 Tax=Photinus pyralis TaxID=7054 RepID=UPI0012675253|nr:uncharacterized protein LOC116168078 [Photinus pyralis]
MAEAKFCLRMWESNVDDFLEQLVVTNVLGMKWNRRSDTLSCFVNVKGVEKATTKRIILAEVAKIFDPLGILAPVTLVPKLLLQETWNSKLGWDESVSSEVSRKFLKWKHDIALLNLLEIPRWACRGNKQSWTLHTFCDASKSGYAATVFLRSEINGTGMVQLLMAKSRVAPLKDITINRLELISCEIGSRLCQTVENSLKLDDVNRYFWTDSTTALSWIKRNDNWGTFVGNRVKKILSNTEPEEWRHVPGSLNPADLPSRGCDARSLLESKWWEGPAWLKDVEQWPINKYVENEDEVQQERKRMVTAFNAVMKDEIPWYFPTKFLTVEELRVAEQKLLFMVQKEVFTDKNKSFPFNVEKDTSGLLRVKTRITMRKDSDYFVRPILLPSRHPVVDALIHEEHLDKCHAGVQYLVSHLREKVWILKGRKAIQHVIRNCVKCRRFRRKAPDPIMAPLPENRVRDAHPFEIIGIDYAGPMYLKDGSKVCVALYTCAVYRAVHLELVTNLTTEAFLMSLRRFVARNGRPSVIYTDNGTNFVGANRLLAGLEWGRIEKETSVQKIKWILNPPSAPWYGGWFERLVRTMKELLVRVLGSSILNYEELVTVLCDVQGVINGRPLTYVFENDDLLPLTPSMFLQGVREVGVPDIDMLDNKGFQKRYRLRQRLMNDLRHRFRKEYIGMLIDKKRKTNDITLKVGDVVLVGSDNKKRLAWPIGRITEMIRGRDGICRVAKLKTSRGVFIRPVQRLYPMEVSSEDVEELDAKNKCKLKLKTEDVGESQVLSKAGRVIRKPDRLNYEN